MNIKFRVFNKVTKEYVNFGTNIFKIKNRGNYFEIITLSDIHRLEYYSGFNEFSNSKKEQNSGWIYDGDVVSGKFSGKEIRGVMRVSDHQGIYIDDGDSSYDPFEFTALKITGNANLDEIFTGNITEAIEDFRSS
ncbi:MAG: hypothetical protein WDA47_07155 [Bacilli bacterium]